MIGSIGELAIRAGSVADGSSINEEVGSIASLTLIRSWASTFGTCYIAVITDVAAVAEVRIRTFNDARVVAIEIVSYSCHVLASRAVGGVVDAGNAGFEADRTDETSRQFEVVGQHAVVEIALIEERVLIVDF